MKTPYQLRIVLHFDEHPQITAAYRDRVGRDLGDAVQAALGDLGRVEVVGAHPKLNDVLHNGLKNTLEGWKERNGVKTHFVLVRYNGFEFEIEAAQHDGVTGQASQQSGQVVRLERTRDREFVARTAALLVVRDFGLIGTVEGAPDGQGLVKVVLKGGGLGAPLGPWAQKDEVFGLVGIPSDNGAATVFPWLLLRVEKPPADGARDGACTCRLYFRHVNPFLNPGGFAGFRCVKLGTTRGPVRLRLTQRPPQGSAPLDEALVAVVRRFGFEGEEKTRLREETADGGVDTQSRGEDGVFNHLAFVSIYGGNGTTPRVPKLPVPILTGEPIEVVVPAAAAADGSFRDDLDRWTRDVNDSYLVQANLFKRLNEMAGKPERLKEALDEAKAGLERSRADSARLEKKRGELERELQKLPRAQRPNLSAWDDRLKKMRDAEDQLVKFRERLDETLREVNDPKRKELLARMGRARLLEEKYDYAEAIAIYREAVKHKGLDTPEVREKLARLEKEWQTHGPAHQEARDFIYNEWPKLDAERLKARLDEARKAFDECKRVRDRLGPLKMLETMPLLQERLKKELEPLKPRLNPEDEPKAKLIVELGPELEKLETDLSAYLKATAPPMP